MTTQISIKIDPATETIVDRAKLLNLMATARALADSCVYDDEAGEPTFDPEARDDLYGALNGAFPNAR